MIRSRRPHRVATNKAACATEPAGLPLAWAAGWARALRPLEESASYVWGLLRPGAALARPRRLESAAPRACFALLERRLTGAKVRATASIGSI
jgi:hypothetical protein